MKPVFCIGKDLVERTFYYDANFDELDQDWLIRVFDDQQPKDGHAFEMKYKPLSDVIWRQADIHHHGMEKYRSKGIPDAMIPEISRQYKVVIVSSPTQGQPGEYEEDIRRSPDATKMWDRLRAKGIAGYCADADIYFLMNFMP